MFIEDVHIDVYYYECALCKKEVKTTNIKKCIICNRMICETCFKEGFCEDHYNLLSSEGMLKLNELVEEKNNKEKKLYKQGFFLEFVVCLPFLIFFYYMYSSIKDVWILIVWAIALLISMMVVIYKMAEKINQLYIDLKEDKITLFNRFAKEMEIYTPKIEKKCEKCGRILKSDSEYCDICGSKI